MILTCSFCVVPFIHEFKTHFSFPYLQPRTNTTLLMLSSQYEAVKIVSSVVWPLKINLLGHTEGLPRCRLWYVDFTSHCPLFITNLIILIDLNNFVYGALFMHFANLKLIAFQFTSRSFTDFIHGFLYLKLHWTAYMQLVSLVFLVPHE